MDALHFEALTVVRGGRAVVRDLSLNCRRGAVLHVLGANGAGKTSLLETLCGLRAPAAGRVVGRPAAAELHWIGHRNALHPALSPTENLRYWCRLHAESPSRVASALERAGLARVRHRPCGRLSMGQRRRAALARLLAAPRPWWFLDEPLAGLDVAGAEFTAALLAEHAAAGGGAVVSSHQPFPVPIAGLQRLELD